MEIIKVVIINNNKIMFNKKIKEQLKELQEFKESIIACDKCGQLIFKKDAIKQKSEIKRKYMREPFGIFSTSSEEYIYNDYFCKRCENERIKKGNNKSKKK